MSDISRRTFLKNITLGSAAMSLPLASGRNGFRSFTDQQKPNIILFLTDDHAQWDSGCYGNNIIMTPNIDRLAGEGMRLDRAFSVTPTCTPSRTSFYTGLAPHRHGAYENHSPMTASVETLPDYLGRLGYRVLLAGKTHIRPKSKFPFEYMDTEGDWNSVIVHDNSDVARFLSREANNSQPFCLVIATNNPHVPWPREAEYKRAHVRLHPFHIDTPETRQAMANYYTDVTKMDREVGRTLDLLEENGLAEQTAFIYTSDHGPQFPHGKWELYDYGTRIPFIIRWPRKVKPGSTSSAMISSVDLLPTLMEMAGGASPANLDGESFQPVLKGEKNKHRETVFATHSRDLNMNYFPIRSVREERFKYIWNVAPERPYTCHITNSNQFKENGGAGLFNSWLERANTDPKARKRVQSYQHRPGEELYDLKEDPHELQNLAEEPEYDPAKIRLRNKLKKWLNQQGDEALERTLPSEEQREK